MRLSFFRSTALVGLVFAGALGATAAQAQQTSMLNGQPIRIATSVVVFEEGDDALIERLRAELTASVRPTDPLPYHTLQEIPDARTLGYGDCKSFSVAMRNMLIEQGFPKDALLLAAAKTEKGEPHMVLLIRGKHNGVEMTWVYDSRVRHITTVEDLIKHGYEFEGRESAPGPDAVLVNFDGFNLS